MIMFFWAMLLMHFDAPVFFVSFHTCVSFPLAFARDRGRASMQCQSHISNSHSENSSTERVRLQNGIYVIEMRLKRLLDKTHWTCVSWWWWFAIFNNYLPLSYVFVTDLFFFLLCCSWNQLLINWPFVCVSRTQDGVTSVDHVYCVIR